MGLGFIVTILYKSDIAVFRLKNELTFRRLTITFPIYNL